ncbi:MAG: alanine racemase [Verrucomicrobiota bacterium]
MSGSDPGALRRCWAEIDLQALHHNAEVAKELAGNDSALMAVVKADGYGHGIREVARALSSHCQFLGVANLVEAEVVADFVDNPTKVFLLGAALPSEREEIVARGFSICLSNREEAAAFDEIAKEHQKSVEFHLAIDTGMGRIGFPEEEVEGLVRHLDRYPRLRCTGIYSHLPSADEDEAFTASQIGKFAGLVNALARSGCTPEWRHLGNSAGLIGYETLRQHTNLVRPGLMLFGVSPRPDWVDSLQPLLTWKTRITLVRDLPPGRGISYGRTFRTKRTPFTRVTTLAAGYGDGYPRHLSGNGAEVLIGGKRCPLLGRVTMDQIMVDATDVGEVSVGDEVVLLGKQESAELTARELADKAGTIPWEIFTGITRRVERVYC